MERANIFFFAVMLLGCHSKVIFGSSPNADSLEKLDEATKNLKDLFRRDEYDDSDMCLTAVSCIVSSDMRLYSGTVYEGIQFSMGKFSQLCRSAEEYLTCYDQAAQDYMCGYQSTAYANMSRLMHEHFCEDPSALQSVVQCFNMRYIQTMGFGEFKEYLGWEHAFGFIGNRTSPEEKSEKKCRLQGEYFYVVMDRIGNKCGSDVFTFFCDMFTEPSLVQLFENSLRFEICPTETYSVCRYSYSYNWSPSK
ncbi:uncharacterized protein LOC117330684 [Pecten maximus]|uniref:uncharacterized protein LOC117330684 n=1 Tax=Pecten maximus TaxID=6579 RepID=UPI0014581B89|nr:uncharacterized protein LOC117330684 [Pecten maximus]